MGEAKDDEPAFPRDHRNEGHNGLTLRDYFAAKAMPMLATEFYGQRTELEGGTVAALVAKVAYEFADAMLAARQS